MKNVNSNLKSVRTFNNIFLQYSRDKFKHEMRKSQKLLT